MLNYDSPTSVRRALEKLGIRLQKRWGQNFLINKGARQRIVSLIDPKPEETVWEVGPGLGSLTELLLPQVARLLAFEIDRGLIRFLEENFQKEKNFVLVQGDVLKTWRSQIKEHGLPAKIAGNLPYSSASALIADLAEERILVERLVFTVQRELAKRMTARPGSKNYSSFSVLCQSVYKIEECMVLKPNSFLPAPEVFSTVVVMSPKKEVRRIDDWGFFLRLLRILFRSRRKMIRNNLLAGGLTSRENAGRLLEAVKDMGIDPKLRSERLSPPELLRFSQSLAAFLKNL